MTITYGVSLIVTSIVLPFVVALLQNESWSARTKQWIALAVCLVAGVAYVITSGTPLSDIPTVSVTFVGGCQTAYLLFSAIGIKSKILDALARVKLTVEPKKDDGSTSTDTDATKAA
jgi:chromate transport protein ChrA